MQKNMSTNPDSGNESMDSKIITEIYKILLHYEIPPHVRATVASWKNTLPDDDVLAELEGINESLKRGEEPGFKVVFAEAPED